MKKTHQPMHIPIIDTVGTFSVCPVLLRAMVSPPKIEKFIYAFFGLLAL